MSMVGFPLLLVPFAIYNIIAFLMPSVSFTDPLVRLRLVSGAEWPIALSDVLLTLGILLLLLEVMKGARAGGKYLTDHLLSLLVFGGSAAEFVLWPKFGTSTYFLLVLLAMVDFLSGIVLRGRRTTRTQPAPRAAVARADATVLETPPGEARVEPVPAPAAAEATSAASVAESVLMDHPEPKTAQPAVTASEPAPVTVTAPAPTPAPAGEPSSAAESEPSPQIPSPDLQPGSGAPASPETPKQ